MTSSESETERKGSGKESSRASPSFSDKVGAVAGRSIDNKGVTSFLLDQSVSDYLITSFLTGAVSQTVLLYSVATVTLTVHCFFALDFLVNVF